MGKSKNKGNRFEREVAKWIKEHDGIDGEHYAVTESGRLGAGYNSLGFDIPAIRYSVECKHRSSVPKWLMEAWEQVIEVNGSENDKHKTDKAPLLVIKKNYKPLLHCITEERHAELLRKEKKYDKTKT
jgi:hypothetical protein